MKDKKQIENWLRLTRAIYGLKDNYFFDTELSLLSPRLKKIISMRFGLEDGITRTLEEVGKEFGVTRERIRQLEAKALEGIRCGIKTL